MEKLYSYKKIKQFPKYEINTLGEVRIIKSQRLIAPLKTTTDNGYEQYSLQQYVRFVSPKVRVTTQKLLEETFTPDEMKK